MYAEMNSCFCPFAGLMIITKYMKNLLALFMQLPDTKALTIFSVIKDLLIRCSLSLSNCRGQAFDGAANMSGKNNGVQALIKKEEKCALYVHCLNLCVQCIAKHSELIRNMSFLYDLLQLIKSSPKRLTIFNNMRAQIHDDIKSPALKSLCPTRWTVRNGSIDSVLKNYLNIMKTLEEVKGTDEYAAKRDGLLEKMESFDTFFGLKLAHLLFGASEQFSTNLQAKDITIQEATRGAELLITQYKSLRTEATFDKFYGNVLNQSSLLTEEPTLPI